MSKRIKIFCPDTSEVGGWTKSLIIQTENLCKDIDNYEWENIVTQGGLIWWKMIKKSPGVILHDAPFIGYEIE